MNKENIRVFKFRNGNENDLDSIFDNYMWFSKLTELNDPYEGYAHFSNEDIDDDFRESFLTSLYEHDPDIGINASIEAKKTREKHERNDRNAFANYIDTKAIEIISNHHKECKDNYKILSLSLEKDNHTFPAPLNNMLMWSHYANGFKGFCIEFNFHKLTNSLMELNNSDIATSPVNYALDGTLPKIKIKTFMQSTIDNSDALSFEIFSAFVTKEKSWVYENEIRLISEKGGKLQYDPECINAIYVSEKAPAWLKSCILSCVTFKKTKIKVFLVDLHESEFKFGYRQINA